MLMLGRKNEIRVINNMVKSQKADLLAIVGRRRVGKTFLIHSVVGSRLDFSFVGTQHGSLQNQLSKFAEQLGRYANSSLPIKTPSSWSSAFSLLTTHLEESTKRKKIIFFDEFPWIDSHKSGFLDEFGYWWNNWAAQQNITVIICGSAASWMIRKVINAKGGLHNRVTKTIHLKPFGLEETKSFLLHHKIRFSNYQLLQLYMVTGGVPFYLQAVERGESVVESIDRLCFAPDGILHNEFINLYAALFDNAANHIEVIKLLGSKWKGLTRSEIINQTSHKNGGGLTRILEELEASDFIIKILPYGKKKKDTLYRLVDEYSLFYLKYLDGKRTKHGDWQKMFNSQQYISWAGYAFENICIKHSHLIQKALGVENVFAEVSSYSVKGSKEEKGMQIDMLIDRADNTINICEMKFYNAQWKMTKADAMLLANRRAQFQSVTKTKKSLINTIITIHGIQDNHYAQDVVDKAILFDDLLG